MTGKAIRSATAFATKNASVRLVPGEAGAEIAIAAGGGMT